VLYSASTTFFHPHHYYSSNSVATYSFYSFLVLIMGHVKRKTDRKEHETPWRTWFRCYIGQGFSQRDAARKVGAVRSTAQGWLSDRRPPIRTVADGPSNYTRETRNPIRGDQAPRLTSCRATSRDIHPRGTKISTSNLEVSGNEAPH